MKQVVLYSSHEEVGRIDIEKIEYIYAWSPRKIDEDLIKIVTLEGAEYFCDEIEFI